MGERPTADQPALASALTGLASAWPALALTRLGSFGRGLHWVGPAHPQGAANGSAPPWPTVLAAQLQQRLRQAGIAFDARTLRLHATLVRGARRDARALPGDFADALPIESAHWTLALGCSGPGSTAQRRYRWREASG